MSANLLQLLLDDGTQFVRFSELLYERLLQFRKPLLEGHAVIFGRRRADVAAGRQDVVVFPSLLQQD